MNDGGLWKASDNYELSWWSREGATYWTVDNEGMGRVHEATKQ